MKYVKLTDLACALIVWLLFSTHLAIADDVYIDSTVFKKVTPFILSPQEDHYWSEKHNRWFNYSFTDYFQLEYEHISVSEAKTNRRRKGLEQTSKYYFNNGAVFNAWYFNLKFFLIGHIVEDDVWTHIPETIAKCQESKRNLKSRDKVDALLAFGLKMCYL